MEKKILMAMSIVQLAEKAEAFAAELGKLQDNIEKEGRVATAEEQAAISNAVRSLEAIEEERVRREKETVANNELMERATNARATAAKFGAPQRLTQPENVQRITGGDKPGASKGTFGFQSLAEYVNAARTSKATSSMDPRIANAATTYGREAVLPDGGFAVPPEYAATIEKVMDGSDDSLVKFVDERPTGSNRYEQPIDEEKPWTGGISVSWDGEGSQATGQKPKLAKLEIPVHKVRGMVLLTDELLEDAPAIQSMLTTGFAEALLYALNNVIVKGDGASQPLGIMNSDSKIEVAKKAGQAADTIVADNITAMWSRLHQSARASAVWLINQDLEQQLPLMTIGNQPVYLPPGGLTGQQYGTIFGRPVVLSEEMEQLGDAGDIALFGGKSYLLMRRRGATFASSMHFAFDQDLQSVKVVARYGGASKWRKALARKNGSANTLSNIVTLAARA